MLDHISQKLTKIKKDQLHLKLVIANLKSCWTFSQIHKRGMLEILVKNSIHIIIQPNYDNYLQKREKKSYAKKSKIMYAHILTWLREFKISLIKRLHNKMWKIP